MTTWDDKPNDYGHAVRLLAQCRNDTIEECARVAEQYWIAVEQGEQAADGIGDAIRALKDKP